MTSESDNNDQSPVEAVDSGADGGNPLTIDVVSDVVCPWCYVGKRQLEQALQSRRSQFPAEPSPQVQWHPFQLNPDIPAAGLARADYLKAKFGDASGGSMYEQVRAAAAEAGMELQIDRISRQPNTIAAHALIAMAQADGQDSIVEALFAAYFVHGRDLTQDDVLIEAGRAANMPEPVIEAALTDESVHQAIAKADAQAREMGISGVPFFIFNQRLAVSGAAGAQTLLAAIEKATAEASETPAQ